MMKLFDEAYAQILSSVTTVDFFCDELRKLPTHRATIVNGKLYVMDRNAVWQYVYIDDDFDDVCMTMYDAIHDYEGYENILNAKHFTF